MNESFFLDPKNDRQKHYEALSASYVDKLPDEIAADKFGYTYTHSSL